MCVCVCEGGYAWDKNTSARLCAKNADGAYAQGGDVFAGHYGIIFSFHWGVNQGTGEESLGMRLQTYCCIYLSKGIAYSLRTLTS